MRYRVLSLLLVMGLVATVRGAEPTPIPLWPNGAPGSEAKKDTPETVAERNGEQSVTAVHNPSITAYLPSKETATGVAVVIFPGGGHRNLAITHEGYNVGRWLAERGIAGFVVKYRLAREPNSTYTIEEHAMMDTQRAIRLVRSRAAEWNIRPEAVGVMGFSAGGELAAMSSMRMEGPKEGSSDPIDKLSAAPNFQALIYPGQSGNIKPAKGQPPAFLAAGYNDRQDISEGLANVYLLFKKAEVSTEFHIYAKVGHGFGLRPTLKPPAGHWPEQFREFLVNQQFITTPAK